MMLTEGRGEFELIMKMARDRLTSALEMVRYRAALHDLAHCTNEAEVKAAILKHKDVIRECM